MQLSERLKRIAQKTEKCHTLADIGTDHAYIPIYLIKKGVIERAIAGDISVGSVKKAQMNIRMYGLEDKIQTRVGNGLKIINEDEKIDTVIMAGMGGMLSIEIMQSSPKAVENVNTLILQPQRDIDKVRRYIHKIGFKIKEEDMFIDSNKFYNIMVCIHENDYEYSERDYEFGKILLERKSRVLKEYIEKEMYKMDRVINSITNKEEEHIIKRKEELEKKYKMYEEVFRWF